jgi:hypothetical protein
MLTLTCSLARTQSHTLTLACSLARTHSHTLILVRSLARTRSHTLTLACVRACVQDTAGLNLTELKPGGDKIKLTPENVEEFVELSARTLMIDSVRR